ncbi:MAG: DUF2179 domain-containing protein [Candidatus Omnitrophica bacterium]|nr:DUF2179 domain-containing protein [Candidatus Omnitrophota bacterium]
MHSFLDSNLFTYGILPALIFAARILDMSLDTLRIMMIGRGRKFTASVLGFFEVSIWLLVARQVIAHLPNVACFFAYAGGFATGNYVGMWIEERMASGAQIIRIMVNKNGREIVAALQKNGNGATIMSGHGVEGAADIIFSIVKRRDAKSVINLIKSVRSDAFYTLEDIREVGGGFFPASQQRRSLTFFKRK